MWCYDTQCDVMNIPASVKTNSLSCRPWPCNPEAETALQWEKCGKWGWGSQGQPWCWDSRVSISTRANLTFASETSRDHLLIQDSSRLSTEISGILSRKTAAPPTSACSQQRTECFIGWSTNHVNNLRFKSSLETKEITSRKTAEAPMLRRIHYRGVQWEGGAVDGGSII